MTRRLVGLADMHGDDLDRVAAAVALACALTGGVATGEDIRAALVRSGLDDTPEHVAAVQRRLGASRVRPTPRPSDGGHAKP